jgi:predicted transglutaminase-like cysteine proteinase
METLPFIAAKTVDAHIRRALGCIALLFLALTVAASPASARLADDQLPSSSANLANASFGSVEIGINARTISPKATDLFNRIDRESGAYSDCSREDGSCPPEITRWRETISSLNGTKGFELLTAVNTAVNGMISYRDDRSAYGKADYWATPKESLTGYGDCEDYAIVKYLSLIELGIPHDRMRIVVLKDKNRQIGHAVLAVSLDTATYVLDNVRTQVMLDSELTHYQPIYSFNKNQQWLNVAVRPRSDQVAASNVGAKRVGAIPPAAQDEAAAGILHSGTGAD